MGAVDVAQFLQGDPGAGHLAVPVTGRDCGGQPLGGAGGQPFGAAAPQAADPLQRVALAATVPAGVLLPPAADLVDGVGGQPDGNERTSGRQLSYQRIKNTGLSE